MSRNLQPKEIKGPVLFVRGNCTIQGHDDHGRPFGPLTITDAMDLRLVLSAKEYGYLKVMGELLDRSEREAQEARQAMLQAQSDRSELIRSMSARVQEVIDWAGEAGYLPEGDHFLFSDGVTWGITIDVPMGEEVPDGS